MHGHWVIDVRNPDGTLASHVEFENALTQGGADVLAMILGGPGSTVQSWAVVLNPSNCCPFGGSPGDPLAAFISKASLPPPPNATPLNTFSTLTVARVNSTAVFKGTATATASGQISAVNTQVSVVDQTLRTFPPFSGTVLPAVPGRRGPDSPGLGHIAPFRRSSRCRPARL